MKRLFIFLAAFATGIAAMSQAPADYSQLQQGEGKKISVLGDSYSTFRGWIPRGYSVWYPAEGNDVKQVEQTWWYQLMKDGGYRLERNNSYSGSTVCNTGYNRQDYSDCAFISRMNLLGNPDIILIFGATNDCWAGSPLGEYQYRGIDRQTMYSFRPAMAYLLDELKTLYPDTEMYFVMNTDMKEEIVESIRTICSHYSVPVIELHDIDKQQGHPSIAGMKAIAAQVKESIEEKGSDLH